MDSHFVQQNYTRHVDERVVAMDFIDPPLRGTMWGNDSKTGGHVDGWPVKQTESRGR
jgi:hypothetical protein